MAKDKRDRQIGTERKCERWEVGGALFKEEHSACTQEELSVATAEDVYPKVRPVKMLEC